MSAHETHIDVTSLDPLEGTPVVIHEGTPNYDDFLPEPYKAPIISYPEVRSNTLDLSFRARRLGRMMVGGAAEFVRTAKGGVSDFRGLVREDLSRHPRTKVAVGAEWPSPESLPEYGPPLPADEKTPEVIVGDDALKVTDNFSGKNETPRTSQEPTDQAIDTATSTEAPQHPKTFIGSLKSFWKPKNGIKGRLNSVSGRGLARAATPIAAVGLLTSSLPQAADKFFNDEPLGSGVKVVDVKQLSPSTSALTPEQRAQMIINGATTGGEYGDRNIPPIPSAPSAPASEESSSAQPEATTSEQDTNAELQDASSGIERVTLPTDNGEVVVGIFCAPSPYDNEPGENKVSPETVIRELGGTRPELHPRCVPTGRMTTSIFVDRNPYTVESQTYPEGQRVIDHNLELLEMMKQLGGTYFVDDYRFFSGDKDLIAKAFSDYDAYVRSGTFRLEMIDEANEENTQLQIDQLKVMNEVLDVQYPGLLAQDLVRPTVAITPGYKENIRAFAEFGINKIAFDAYDLDVTDRVSREIGAMPDALRPDFLFYIPATEWVHTATGELASDSTKMTPEYLTKWFAKVKQLREEGVPGFEGYAYFTGFKAEDNVLGLSFPSTLSDKATFDQAKNLTDTYVPAVNEAVNKALGAKVAENQRVLDRLSRTTSQRAGPS